jgi:hypothetical protein
METLASHSADLESRYVNMVPRLADKPQQLGNLKRIDSLRRSYAVHAVVHMKELCLRMDPQYKTIDLMRATLAAWASSMVVEYLALIDTHASLGVPCGMIIEGRVTDLRNTMFAIPTAYY